MRKIVLISLAVLLLFTFPNLVKGQPPNIIEFHEVDIIETCVETYEVKFRYWFDPGNLWSEPGSYREMEGTTADGIWFFYGDHTSEVGLNGIQFSIRLPDGKSFVIFDQNKDRRFNLDEGDKCKPEDSSKMLSRKDVDSAKAKELSERGDQIYLDYLPQIMKWIKLAHTQGEKELAEAKRKAAEVKQKGEER